MEPPEDIFTQLAAILESGSDSDLEENEEDEEDNVKVTLLLENEEAKEKLAQIEHASQALLAELSTLEAEYEIEKSCREQAEAYAAQVNRENKHLKRISSALLPRLSTHLPGDLVKLDAGEEMATEAALDPVCPYLEQIKDLKAKVSQLLEEKKELSLHVKALQDRVQQLQEELEEERSEKLSRQALMEEKEKTLKKIRRVSCLVTEEYRKLSQQLDLEEELRQKAEVFAHQMLVKQKAANRQSMILMKNVGPDVQLLQALDEVAKTTQALEDAKQEYQTKVEDLEAQLVGRPQREDLEKLQASLAMAEEEKVCLGKRLLQMEEQNAALEERVKVLEEAAKGTETTPPQETCPIAPPPPPPPPPPLPPNCPAPIDPLMAIRQRKGTRPLKRDNANTDDVKAKAVEEMMSRIKSGVVLRPATRNPGDSTKSATASKRRSTMMELQGLLAQNTTKRPIVRSSRRRCSQKKVADSQLDSILQRRRRMVDCLPSTQVLQKQPTFVAEGSPQGEAQKTMAGDGAQSHPERELLKTPHPNNQCSVTSPGDSEKPAVESSSRPEEKYLVATQLQQRAASLQTSRRVSPILGTHTGK